MSVCEKRLTRVQSAYVGVWRSGKPLGEGEWEESGGRQELTSEQSTFSKDKTWEMYTWVGGMGSYPILKSDPWPPNGNCS